MMEVSQACRSPGRTIPEVGCAGRDVTEQLVIWEKDPVDVLQPLFITSYRCSLALRAYHITAASGEVAWTLYVQLNSEENIAYWWRPMQQVKEWSSLETSCWSRREMAVLKSQLKIKAGSTQSSQLALGLSVQDSCQKANLAPGDGTGATAFSCGVPLYQLH